MVAPTITRVGIGAEVTPPPWTLNDLATNGNRVVFGVNWQEPGRFSINVLIDGSTATTQGGTVPVDRVGKGKESLYFFTMPKSALTAADHTIKFEVTVPSGTYKGEETGFTLTAPKGAEEKPPAPEVPPSFDIGDMWSALSYRFDTITVDGGNLFYFGKLCAAQTVKGDQAHTVTARIPGSMSSGEFIPAGNTSRLQPLPLAFVVNIDGAPVATTEFSQPYDRASIDQVSATIPANTLSRGPHRLSASIGFNFSGGEGYGLTSPECTLTVTGLAARTVSVAAPPSINAGAAFEIRATVLNDGVPSNGETATVLVDGVSLTTASTMAGQVSAVVQNKDQTAGSMKVCVSVPETSQATAAEGCATITVMGPRGRPIDLVIPKVVVDGMSADLVVSLFCGTSPSNGETVIFTVDGAEIGRKVTANGTAKVAWTATMLPSRYHKVCAKVMRSDLCPGQADAYTCKTVTVSRAGESVLQAYLAEMEVKAAAAPAAPAAEKVAGVLTLGQALQMLGVPQAGGGVLSIPIQIIPPAVTLPEVTAPEVTAPPTQGVISIPSVLTPPRFAGATVTVSIDGEVIGAPPIDRVVDAGRHIIKVEVKGLTPVYKTVSIRAGETQVLSDLEMR